MERPDRYRGNNKNLGIARPAVVVRDETDPPCSREINLRRFRECVPIFVARTFLSSVYPGITNDPAARSSDCSSERSLLRDSWRPKWKTGNIVSSPDFVIFHSLELLSAARTVCLISPGRCNNIGNGELAGGNSVLSIR